MTEYIRVESSVDLKTLTTELNAALPAVSYLVWNAPDNLHLYYSPALTAGEETTMDATIAAHTA